MIQAPLSSQTYTPASTLTVPANGRIAFVNGDETNSTEKTAILAALGFSAADLTRRQSQITPWRAGHAAAPFVFDRMDRMNRMEQKLRNTTIAKQRAGHAAAFFVFDRMNRMNRMEQKLRNTTIAKQRAGHAAAIREPGRHVEDAFKVQGCLGRCGFPLKG